MNKQLRRLIPLMVVLTLFMSSFSFATPISVYYENEKVKMPTDPVVKEGRTLVPLRSTLERMGLVVDWDNVTRTAYINKDSLTIKMPIGSKYAEFTEWDWDIQDEVTTTVELDAPASIINGHTLVPIRLIAESSGTSVNWDGNTRSVLLNSNYPFGKYKVTRVVDGDTIKVDFNGKEESLRLIGVDTPESVHPDASKNVPDGKTASDFTKSRLEGKEIAIEFDVQERDQYGRLLGYVWHNGEMFNKTLLKEGYAKVATYPPNVKYVNDFTKLQEQARNSKKGFWRGGEFGQPAQVVTPKPQPTPQPKTEVKPVPSTGNLVITMTGSKYHRPTCRTVKQIKQKVTAQQAQSMGYTACKVCNP